MNAILAPLARECMLAWADVATIQVKNLPEEVHAVLRRRAAEAGQSLQEYMVGELTRVAQSPTIDEVLERIGHRSGGRLSLKQAAADQRSDRRRRSSSTRPSSRPRSRTTDPTVNAHAVS